MSGRAKISVAIITYNQQDTIAQTLDSVLCQRGDFDLELVIGEDASTDGTLSICQDYAHRYPEQIILLSGEQNMGIMGNSTRTLRACTGDYVNMLAGDDYWCDDHKLDKQLRYMREHPEFGVVSTDGYRLLVKTGKLVEGLPPLDPVPDGDIRDYYHDRYGGVYAMPLTLLIRRDLMRFVDMEEYTRLGFSVEDYPMQSVLAHHTRFGHIPDKTCVYRVYRQSATFVSFDSPRYEAYHRGLVEIRRYLNGLYPDDVPFTEDWAEDYLFYKFFLQRLHRREYKQARLIVEETPESVRQTSHYRRARKATRSMLHFTAFRAYKEMSTFLDLSKRL